MSLDRSLFQQILSDADEQDLTRLQDIIKQRRTLLAQLRAATLAAGDAVRIADNISPASLKGATGVITTIQGKRVDIRLDKRSTDKVRWGRSNRIVVPSDVEEYEVHGVPIQCVIPQEAA